MKLYTKNLVCTYENGNIRYIKHGKTEVLRMIYTAVRNELWHTADLTIKEERIQQYEASFEVSYHAEYKLNEIYYSAKIDIIGNEDDSIAFDFNGVAQNDFLKNRIGVCIHHPINECIGKRIVITHSDQSMTTSFFPFLISPHQPFFNVQGMQWQPSLDINAKLIFKGESFETEDQRNWTDGSFKTYSTPLDLPWPVEVKAGETINHSVTLSIMPCVAINESENSSTQDVKTFPFPKIGYAKSLSPLSQEDIRQLQLIPFDHYRVECKFDDHWEKFIEEAVNESIQLNAKIELVLFIDNMTESHFKELVKFIRKEHLSHILLTCKEGFLPTEEQLVFWISRLSKSYSGVPIGSGTDWFFAELNRNRPSNASIDFISFSISPQVHLFDNRSLIENLEAQKYTIATAKSFYTGPLHISPISLKMRTYSDQSKTIDNRQHSEFIAAWTALTIKYIAGADSITLFETKGDKGVLNNHGRSPVYDLLKKIKMFSPEYIIQDEASSPLMKDQLILVNKDKEELRLNFDFIEFLSQEVQSKY
jgi:D-apionolactonase